MWSICSSRTDKDRVVYWDSLPSDLELTTGWWEAPQARKETLHRQFECDRGGRIGFAIVLWRITHVNQINLEYGELIYTLRYGGGWDTKRHPLGNLRYSRWGTGFVSFLRVLLFFC